MEKRAEKPLEDHLRDLREEMAEMLLRVERLERATLGVVREEANGLGGAALGG